ncbi:MAG: DUF3892 domain-containing protein [Candidatus Limiplasma sp.]|nr:DUF3892 domain-containing protein [Candidatus Limiplasma sp.]
MAQVSRSVGYEFIGTVTRVLPAGNRKVGKTMAYYNIAKVHYHDKDNDTFIEKVKTSGGIEKMRSTVVSDIEAGHIIMTDPPTGTGAEVHIYTVSGVKYIRTDKNAKAKDNLENLPTY